MNVEKRRFSRANYRVETTLEAGSLKIKGQVMDVSLKGAFVCSREKLPLGQHVDMVVEADPKASPIVVRGKVVRVVEEGIAIEFESLDLDSFVKLKEIVSYNIGNREKVSKEFIKYMYEKTQESLKK